LCFSAGFEAGSCLVVLADGIKALAAGKCMPAVKLPPRQSARHFKPEGILTRANGPPSVPSQMLRARVFQNFSRLQKWALLTQNSGKITKPQPLVWASGPFAA